MSTLPEVMHHNDLMHQMVLDRARMEELGRVEVVWMYAPAHKVLGFVCKAGFLGAKKYAFNLSQVHTYGAKSILVNSPPQETDADRVNQLESLVGCEVWSDGGQKLGKITDFRFNPQTGDITEYLFTTGSLSALTDGIYRLPPYRILSVGRQRVLIAESGIRSLSLFREGLKQKLKKAEESLKQDYSSVTQEIRSLRQTAQERARLLAEQAKETAQSFNEQLKEGSQTLVEQVKEQAQILQEQLALAEMEPQSGRDRGASAGIDADLNEWDEKWDDEWDIETPPATPTDPHLTTVAPAAAASTAPATPASTPPSPPPASWTDAWDEEPVPTRSEPIAPAASPASPMSIDESWDDNWDDDLWGRDEPSATPAPQVAPTAAVSATSSSTEPLVDSGTAAPSQPASAAHPSSDEDEPWL
jgi:uncharacterized protein YrrD